MNLSEFLAAQVQGKDPVELEPEEGMPGKESGWLEHGKIDLRGTRFLLADLGSVPSEEEGLVIPAASGTYQIEGKVMEYGLDRRISRIRVFRAGIKELEAGGNLGDTITDTAETSLCDVDSLAAWWTPTRKEQFREEVASRLDADEIPKLGVIKLHTKPDVTVLFFSSGFGDGKYPVTELRSGGALCGFEVEFIDPTEGYPFPASAEKVARNHLHAAEEGDGEAQYLVGLCYRDGDGVIADNKQARVWFERAWAQGHLKAGYALAMIWFRGDGVPEDSDKARELFGQLAGKGVMEAVNVLGAMHLHGHGVEKNYEKAHEYFLKAAEQGEGRAQFNLGIMYYAGLGVVQDWKEAVKWYEKASEAGIPGAHANLGHCVLNGEGVEADPKRAFVLFQRGAMAGHPLSCYNLAQCYHHGLGIGKNLMRAKRFYLKAVEAGIPEAKEALQELE